MAGELAKDVAQYLRWPVTETEKVALRAPKTYRRYLIPKLSGNGMREIYHPARRTKALQYAIMGLYLSKLSVHRSAMAYRPALGAPLRRNAEAHAPYPYSVRVDMKDFFPSIKPDDLFEFWRRSEFSLEEEGEAFLTSCLFVFKPHSAPFLAIGAPASPSISNIVMYDIDVQLSGYASALGGTYTRYADDMVFSVRHKGACEAFVRHVRHTLRETDHPCLDLNEDKTHYMSKKGRRVITGLVITPDGRVSLGRQKKRYLRKLVYEMINGELQGEDRDYLQGTLAYALDVEPDFCAQLAQKYGADAIRRALDHNVEARFGTIGPLDV